MILSENLKITILLKKIFILFLIVIDSEKVNTNSGFYSNLFDKLINKD